MVKAEAEMMFFMITVTDCYSFYLCVEFILYYFALLKMINLRTLFYVS